MPKREEAELDGLDPLFGPDGTEGDGVGPLPGFELPVLALPLVGPDGVVRGVDGGQHPDGAEPPDPGPDGPGPPTAAAAPGGRSASAPASAVPTGASRPVAPVGHADTAAPPARSAGSIPPQYRLRTVADAAARRGLTPRPAAPPGPAPERVAGPWTRPVDPAPRPPIENEPSILGLTRRSRSRFGSRLFVAFFVLVYTVILIQLIVSLVRG
jgi:hypothetical protein